MVEFVDDHHVEQSRVEFVEIEFGKRLHRGKYVSPFAGPFTSNESFAEGSVSEDVSRRRLALHEYFVAMSNEQERLYVVCFSKPSVIEARHDGFACAGGHDDEVSVSAMQGTFSGEGFEDFALVAKGSDVEGGEFNR